MFGGGCCAGWGLDEIVGYKGEGFIWWCNGRGESCLVLMQIVWL